MSIRYPYAKTLILAAMACGATMVVQPSVANERIYDREHGDYHPWNSEEELHFRVYQGEHNEPYREFREYDADHQRAYWKWRHEHREHEEHEHHD